MTDRLLREPGLRNACLHAGLPTADDWLRWIDVPPKTSVRIELTRAIDGTTGHFLAKGYAYEGWRRAQGLIGRGSVFGLAPELREWWALRWLRRHGIPAVRPIAAVSRSAGMRLVAHALFTEWVSDAPDLRAVAGDADHRIHHDPALRAAVGTELGRVIGRMHALGFAHGDLFARNILLRLSDTIGAVGDGADGNAAPSFAFWLLDCRRGRLGGDREADRSALLADCEPLVADDIAAGMRTAAS